MSEAEILEKSRKSSRNNSVEASNVTPQANYANDLGLIPWIQLNL